MCSGSAPARREFSAFPRRARLPCSMLGAMVAPVVHAVQTLSIGWKESEVWAEWVTAAGAVFAALFAAWAVYREGQLLETAQEQVKVSQRQIEAMQEQTRAAQAQVEAMHLPVLELFLPNWRMESAERADIWVQNIGNGAALLVTPYLDGRPGGLISAVGSGLGGNGVRTTLKAPAQQAEFTIVFCNTFQKWFKTSGRISDGVVTQWPSIVLPPGELADIFRQERLEAVRAAAAAWAPPTGGRPANED